MYLKLLNLLLICLLAPLVAISLVLLYVYRGIVECILRVQLGHKFVGFLEGTDAIWAIEENSALSVINVLAILEKDSEFQSSVDLLDNFRELVRTRMVNSLLEKLFYRRNKRYGYYFWEKCDSLDLAERVRWLEHDQSFCDGFCNDICSEALQRAVQSACSQPLPLNHSTSWEILIGKGCSKSNHADTRDAGKSKQLFGEHSKKDRAKIPVLFRIHHSLGDGVALLRLLVETLADKTVLHEAFVEVKDKDFMFDHGKRFEETSSVSVSREWNEPRFDVNMYAKETARSFYKDVIDAFSTVSNTTIFRYFVTFLRRSFNDRTKLLELSSFDDVFDEISKKWSLFLRFLFAITYRRIRISMEIMSTLAIMPMWLFQQAIRSMDNSALHGPPLTGDKVISYWLENDFRNTSDHKLLRKIRDIKNITGTRFVDIILAALSSSLHKYFLRIDEAPPKSMTVVLPSRMEEPHKNSCLQNGFSVGLLPLCISQVNGKVSLNPNGDFKMLDRLYDITQANDTLQKGPDYLINYWVMKFLSVVLPEHILRPVLKSYSTMIFSNLPGPEELHILGHTMKHIVFWIPNRNTTGIGCSALSYGGNLNLSLIADKALVKSEILFSQILQNVVYEIDELHDQLTLPRLSKRLHETAGNSCHENGIGLLEHGG